MSVITKAQQIQIQRQPVLPPIIAKPFGFLPERLYSTVIVRALNFLLEKPLMSGDLDFLIGHSVSVALSDINIKFALSLYDNKLIAKKWSSQDDLNISGTLYDYMLLAHRQEDSDALFFQRRLKMEGNTELGLEVKNLLDGIDTETVRFHQHLDLVLHHGIKVFQKLF